MDFHNTTLSEMERQERQEYNQRMALDSETCWEDETFGEFWDAVEAQECPPVGLDDGWALDVILECWKSERSVSSTVSMLWDGYDPTEETPYDFFH